MRCINVAKLFEEQEPSHTILCHVTETDLVFWYPKVPEECFSFAELEFSEISVCSHDVLVPPPRWQIPGRLAL